MEKDRYVGEFVTCTEISVDMWGFGGMELKRKKATALLLKNNCHP